MTAASVSILIPFLAAGTGIALFTLMDAVMKGLSLAIGAYCAMLWRTTAGLGTTGVVMLTRRFVWPGRAALLLHLQRGTVNAFSAIGYFFGLTRLPMGEAIALSFIAPLVALYCAAMLLNERVGSRAIVASLLSLAGVILLVSSRIAGQYDGRAVAGGAAILAAAAVYGYGLVLLRRQAQLASPTELAFFQNAATFLWLLPAAPFLAPLPAATHWPWLVFGAILAQASMMLLGWAYARAEAPALIPVEYTGFLWSVLFGALFFGERLTAVVAAGAALIVAGCFVAARAGRAPPLAAEVAL